MLTGLRKSIFFQKGRQKKKKFFQKDKKRIKNNSWLCTDCLTLKKEVDTWRMGGSRSPELRWKRNWQQKPKISTCENLAISFIQFFSEMQESHFCLNYSLIPLSEVAPMSVNKATRIRIWPLTFCFFWNHWSKMAFLFPSIFPFFLLPQEGSQHPHLTPVHRGRCQQEGQQLCGFQHTAARTVVRKGHSGPRHVGFNPALKSMFSHYFNVPPRTRSTESNWSKGSGKPLEWSICPLNKIWGNRTRPEESSPKTFSRLDHTKLKVTWSEP